jgi:hypothetical protein
MIVIVSLPKMSTTFTAIFTRFFSGAGQFYPPSAPAATRGRYSIRAGSNNSGKNCPSIGWPTGIGGTP